MSYEINPLFVERFGGYGLMPCGDLIWGCKHVLSIAKPEDVVDRLADSARQQNVSF